MTRPDHAPATDDDHVAAAATSSVPAIPTQPTAAEQQDPAGPVAVPAAPDLSAVRSGPWWQAFTGLLPALLMVPLLLLDLRTASVVLAAVASLGVVGYHLWRRQGLTALDALAVDFATVNVVLYFPLGSDVLVDNIDLVFYTLLLLAMSAISLTGRREPWTAQFTRRTVVPDLWATPAFRAMNVATTRLWVVGFAVCDACALLLPDPWQVWVPIAALVVTVRVSRRTGARVLSHALQR